MKIVFRLGLILLCGLALFSQSVFARYNWPNGIYFGPGVVGVYTFFRVNGSTVGTPNPTLTKGKTSAGAAGFTSRLGYAFKKFPFQFDVSYKRIGDLSYDSSQVFSSISPTYNNVTSNLTAVTWFVNGYYNIHFSNKVLPYIGVGVGKTKNKTKLTATNSSGGTLKVDHTISNVAYQGIVGVNFKVANNVLLYVAYHFVDLGKAQWGPWGSGSNRATLKSNNILVHEGEFGIKVFLGDQTPYQPPELISDTD